MKERKWLELKICKNGFEILQDNDGGRKKDHVVTIRAEDPEKTGDTDVLDNGVEKEIDYVDVPEISPIDVHENFEYNDSISECDSILASARNGKTLFEPRKLNLTMFLLAVVLTIAIIVFQAVFYWKVQDQDLRQVNNSVAFFLYNLCCYFLLR